MNGNTRVRVAILVSTPYTIRAEDHVSTWFIRLAALTRYHAPHFLLCIIDDVSSTTHHYYLLCLHGGPSWTSLNSLRNLYEHCRQRRIHNTVLVFTTFHSKTGITSHEHMAWGLINWLNTVLMINIIIDSSCIVLHRINIETMDKERYRDKFI